MNDFFEELSFSSSNRQTTALDEIPHGYGKFGWEATNPIPIASVFENKVYLQKLRTADNRPVTCQRTGSLKSENIIDIIDRYEIYNADGDFLGYLYLCPYHLKTSDKIPEGLLQVKEL